MPKPAVGRSSMAEPRHRERSRGWIGEPMNGILNSGLRRLDDETRDSKAGRSARAEPDSAPLAYRTGAGTRRFGPASKTCSGHSRIMSLKFSMKRAASASYFL